MMNMDLFVVKHENSKVPHASARDAKSLCSTLFIFCITLVHLISGLLCLPPFVKSFFLASSTTLPTKTAAQRDAFFREKTPLRDAVNSVNADESGDQRTSRQKGTESKSKSPTAMKMEPLLKTDQTSFSLALSARLHQNGVYFAIQFLNFKANFDTFHRGP
jgi:hypothetical protein